MEKKHCVCWRSIACVIVLVLLQFSFTAVAQVKKEDTLLIVTADHSDWNYKTSDKVLFTISFTRAGKILSNVPIHIEVGPEKMKPTIAIDTLSKKAIKILTQGLSNPGFLRCVATVEVNGKKFRSLATAAISQEAIKPTVEEPADFDEFWEKGKESMAKVPMDSKMRLIPERSTGPVNIYEVSLQTIRPGARLYGILCVPKKAGKYPAALKVPGAGIRPYRGDSALAANGMITFEIGIHGIPVTMPQEVYYDLASGALYGYPFLNLDNKDEYYYRRVYLGCVRAVDFLASLPEVDTSRLAVYGGSQGGALSIVTAALDHRIKYLSCLYPALSDLTGYFFHRAGGWPHMFAPTALYSLKTDQKKETASYYDVVNFAKRIRVPGFYSWGYNDETCPPTSVYSSYNSIKADKELFIVKESGHWQTKEQAIKVNEWLLQHLRTP